MAKVQNYLVDLPIISVVELNTVEDLEEVAELINSQKMVWSGGSGRGGTKVWVKQIKRWGSSDTHPALGYTEYRSGYGNSVDETQHEVAVLGSLAVWNDRYQVIHFVTNLSAIPDNVLAPFLVKQAGE